MTSGQAPQPVRDHHRARGALIRAGLRWGGDHGCLIAIGEAVAVLTTCLAKLGRTGSGQTSEGLAWCGGAT